MRVGRTARAQAGSRRRRRLGGDRSEAVTVNGQRLAGSSSTGVDSLGRALPHPAWAGTSSGPTSFGSSARGCRTAGTVDTSGQSQHRRCGRSRARCAVATRTSARLAGHITAAWGLQRMCRGLCVVKSQERYEPTSSARRRVTPDPGAPGAPSPGDPPALRPSRRVSGLGCRRGAGVALAAQPALERATLVAGGLRVPSR